MKSFVIKIVIFSFSLFVGLIGLAYLSSYIVKQRHYQQWETDSNTLIMGKGQHYDIVLSGASHARILSRHKNHLRLENILHKKIFNVGQGAASCGVAEQYFYLKYFYDEKNTVDTVLYFLSPPLVFSNLLPIASNTFNYETFSLRFFFRYLRFDAENKEQRLFEYFRSKFTWKWIGLKPERSESMDVVLGKIDSTLIKDGIAKYYKLEGSDNRFKKSCDIIEDEVKDIQAHHSQIVFIIPPAVFGKWPGHDKTLEFAKEMNQKYGCPYYDFSEIIQDPQLYLDHHHLNTIGVILFTENYLKPIFTHK